MGTERQAVGSVISRISLALFTANVFSLRRSLLIHAKTTLESLQCTTRSSLDLKALMIALHNLAANKAAHNPNRGIVVGSSGATFDLAHNNRTCRHHLHLLTSCKFVRRLQVLKSHYNSIILASSHKTCLLTCRFEMKG